MKTATFPEGWGEVSEDLKFILGYPNFRAGPIAHVFQAAGYDIKPKAEDEQAFVLHRMLLHYFRDPVNWRTTFGDELTGKVAQVNRRSEERKVGKSPILAAPYEGEPKNETREPPRSPMVQAAEYIPEDDKPNYSPLQVLHSPAGWYVGTMYNDPGGFQEPGSRDSDYFATKEEAEAFLDAMSSDDPPETRMTP